MIEVPSVSFDAHFSHVPRIETVDFDAERCVDLLTHPLIGLTRQEMSRLHVYVRPDYKLGYTRDERRAIREANPDDYTDAGSCEIIEQGDPIGTPGNVLLTLVYKSGYGVNKLLCHEAIHARTLLRETRIEKLRNFLLEQCSPKEYNRIEAAEEAEADRAMKDTALKALRKDVIAIKRH
jgi:hypothetical protein